MKKIFILLISFNYFLCDAQKASDFIIPTGVAALSFVAINSEKKEIAKEISQFRSKEFIINNIIGKVSEKDVKFETESLASDDSAGLISVAFNCTEVAERGLLLAFLGNNRDANGNIGLAYGFKYIPLVDAQNLFKRIDGLKEKHKKYLNAENDVNNVYIEHDDIKFILYRDAGDKVRVLWNGFEVIWERTAFDRTKRRLDRWFE
ncbi:hypothetical protein [Flavobacterium psychrotrophum]|uniref:hypothetical protein n=1 Tax=Flavobacterium psychrotrophum TaxID=2294119 RepID=UPI000E319616|nr:hypothetical protein [Flavobacterium psychrotrophum]